MPVFDKLLELLTKSTLLGFALAFAGTIFFGGNRYGWWNVPLTPDQSFYLGVATLLGYGIVVGSALANGFRIAFALLDLLFTWIGKVRRERAVMDRLNELTPRQLGALWWISQHPDALINGSIFDDPWKALCSKKFLYASSETAQTQGFRVNKAVYKQSTKIAERIPANLRGQIANGPRP
jgi:hypothetical protein